MTRLFTDLVAQLKLLTPSGHGSHGGTPTYEGKGRNGQQCRQVSTMVIGSTPMTATTKGWSPIRTAT